MCQGGTDAAQGDLLSTRAARERQFDQLYRDTFAQVHAYCVRRVDQRDDVEDVVSEVYASVWRRLDDVLRADSSIAWIYGIAYRVIGNHRRGKARGVRLVDRLGTQVGARRHDDPGRALAAREVLREVERELRALSPLDQELLLLALWEGLSHSDIAEVLGIDAPLVRSRLYRARRRLQRQLRGLFDPEGRDGNAEPDTTDLTEPSSRDRPERRRGRGGTSS